MDTVAINLQKQIEKRLNENPRTFAELEDNSDVFQKFAYETHYRAYCESGWGELSKTDKWKIIWAIAWSRDLANKNGASASWDLFFGCAAYRKSVEPALPKPPSTKDKLKQELKRIWKP